MTAFIPKTAGQIWQRLSLLQGARRNAGQALGALLATGTRGGSAPVAACVIGMKSEPPVEQWVPVQQQVAHLDPSGVVVAMNDQWKAAVMAGDLVTAGLGANYLEACEHLATAGAPSAAKAAQLTRHALDGGHNGHKLVYQNERSWYSLEVLALPADDAGAVVVLEDITAGHALEIELRHRAFHDPLTGLPNRALLTDRLQHAVAGAAREALSLAVLFIDLDDFKSVNDRLGHLAGDATLCEVGRRLADCVRTCDTVGRWGGDEFVVIAERLDLSVTADVLAGRLAERLRVPMQIAGHSLQVRATIGVALLDDHEGAEALLAAADRALIAARRQDRPQRSRGRRSLSESAS